MLLVRGFGLFWGPAPRARARDAVESPTLLISLPGRPYKRNILKRYSYKSYNSRALDTCTCAAFVQKYSMKLRVLTKRTVLFIATRIHPPSSMPPSRRQVTPHATVYKR